MQAKDYLMPCSNGFWCWSDAGDAITWKDGSTIVFRAELGAVLKPFEHEGLPPLGAVLLLIAATRDSWRDFDPGKPLEPRQRQRRLLEEICDGNLLDHKVERVVSALNKLNRFDNDVKFSVEAKQTLVEVVFDDWRPKLPPDASEMVVEILESSVEEVFIQPAPIPLQTGEIDLRTDLRALQAGLGGLTPRLLRMRRRTGLDETVEDVAEELDELNANTARQLLEQLKDDEEHSGLAQVAQQLMPVLSLPRPVSARKDLPLGGVSDITNRGTLDRLLLSELANDDLTLAVRVAVNEAMYLRRESPPSSQNQSRMLLIDSTIRMWGVPRLFAASTALALVAGAAPAASVEAYTPDGLALIESKLHTQDGLVEHLGRLQHEMHPGDSFSEFASIASAADGEVERIVVTSPEVLEDVDFLQAVHDAELLPVFVVTVERTGTCSLCQLTAQGRRLLKRIQIDIDTILKSDQKLIKKNVPDPGSLPASLDIAPFPLRFPQADALKRAWRIAEGALVLTNDSRLLWFEENERGGIEISTSCGKGPLWWSSEEKIDDSYYAVTGYLIENGLKLLRVNLETCNVSEQVLNVPRGPRGFFSLGNTLIAVYADRIETISLKSGFSTSIIQLPSHSSWVQGPFFRDQEHWYVLSLVGNMPELVEVCKDQPGWISMFFSDWIEGPIAVDKKGNLHITSTGKVWNTNLSRFGEFTSVETGGSGKSIALRVAGSGRVINYELHDRQSVNHYFTSIRAFEASATVKERQYRCRFKELLLLTDGTFALLTHKNYLLHLELYESTGARFRPTTDPSVKSRVQDSVISSIPFERIKSPPGTHYKLHLANLKCGSQVFLDSRGLLHFKSCDPTISEFTLILSDSHIAGWSSCGKYFGDRYYLPGNLKRILPFFNFNDATIKPFMAQALRKC